MKSISTYFLFAIILLISSCNTVKYLEYCEPFCLQECLIISFPQSQRNNIEFERLKLISYRTYESPEQTQLFNKQKIYLALLNHNPDSLELVFTITEYQIRPQEFNFLIQQELVSPRKKIEILEESKHDNGYFVEYLYYVEKELWEHGYEYLDVLPKFYVHVKCRSLKKLNTTKRKVIREFLTSLKFRME